MIYLDNAATSWPKPEEVYLEMDKFFRQFGANPGRAGYKIAAHASRKIFDVRESLAAFFGAEDSAQIIFTTSTTHSLNLAIHGIIEKGDHVITSAVEHNSVIRPLKELEKEGIIELSVVGLNAEGQIDLEILQDKIGEKTKLIVISHGSNVTGDVFGLEEIGQISQEKEILLLVDAAQTAGFLPIDVQAMKIDMLAFAGHKSLYGPPGTGGLYIRKGLNVKPIFAGGTGSKSEEFYQPDVFPEKYESGTMNSVGVVGLGVGVEFIKRVGLEKIRHHELLLSKIFLEGLTAIKNIKVYGQIDDELRTPVVSFNIGEESSTEIGYILDQVFDIAVRSGLHCAPLTHQTLGTLQQGTVRAGFGYFNTQEDVETLLLAIQQIAQKIG